MKSQNCFNDFIQNSNQFMTILMSTKNLWIYDNASHIIKNHPLRKIRHQFGLNLEINIFFNIDLTVHQSIPYIKTTYHLLVWMDFESSDSRRSWYYIKYTFIRLFTKRRGNYKNTWTLTYSVKFKYDALIHVTTILGLRINYQ